MRKCQNPDCDNNLPYDCRKEMKYCSVRCRVAMHRKRNPSKAKAFAQSFIRVSSDVMSQEDLDKITDRIIHEIKQAKDI